MSSMEATCLWCKSPMPKKTNKGTIRKYCKNKCSVLDFHARRKKMQGPDAQAERYAALKVVTWATMSPEKRAELQRLYENRVKSI